MIGGLTAFIVRLTIVVWVIMIVLSCVVLLIGYCCLTVLVWVGLGVGFVQFVADCMFVFVFRARLFRLFEFNCFS